MIKLCQINTEKTVLLANSKQSSRKLLSFFDLRGQFKEVFSNLNSSFREHFQLAV